MSNERDGTQYLRGALYGLAAASIWSGWIVVARLGLRTSLTVPAGLFVLQSNLDLSGSPAVTRKLIKFK